MKKILIICLSLMLFLSLTACSNADNSSSNSDKKTDVVVVGGGGAGIAAALSAAQNGAEVVLLEKVGYLGGATMLSGGIIPAVNTKQQVEAGIEDNNEWFARDMLRPSNYSVRKELVYTVVEESKGLIEWMETLGCNFSIMTGSLFYGQSNYRMHISEGSGAGMTQTMIDYLNSIENITVMLQTQGTGLLTNDKGEVIGVSADNGTEKFNVLANNTILATSGFAANQEMLEQYIPEIVGAYPNVAPGATGEGILWGVELGAQVENMKAYQGHAFYNEQINKSLSQSMANMGAIFVNTNGVRFTNEYGGYSELSPHVLAQPNQMAYYVINQAIADATPAFQDYMDAGIVVSGNNASELATNLGVDPIAMEDTFTRYIASIQKGEDEFNKTKLPSNWDGPYYAMEITADLRHTQGGLVTDIDAHVIKEDGSVIQGLYAAGGVTEGFTSGAGAAYMSGDGLLQALIYGKIAGELAATEVKGDIVPTIWLDTTIVEDDKKEEVIAKEDTNTLTYNDGEYEGVSKGHSSNIKINVTVIDGKVSDIKVIEQSETPTIYSSCESTIIEGAVANNGTFNVDTVSGATNSSKGLIAAIDNALELAK